eukprot:CAMPEP_0175085296 /NCGR_PEP_ID=MMETSP0052_2-20121109/28573_1 /TAXON_ID=51329 ORGANISM="Polytomella parva, Strain SAG 63-3" /NCGR_SAMPLE_ID=MMETSP0052_2 /ASSEMBLY_ACC=CAM_ASM_000194 /LENGTH=102 /DNA_ID=CAMNT_0016357269 /DNA_START=423 /DNA_END=728 /DNA_ORIENTATION=-
MPYGAWGEGSDGVDESMDVSMDRSIHHSPHNPGHTHTHTPLGLGGEAGTTSSDSLGNSRNGISKMGISKMGISNVNNGLYESHASASLTSEKVSSILRFLER